VAPLELDLLELGGFENEVEGDLLVELALGFDVGVDLQVEVMPVCLVAEKANEVPWTKRPIRLPK